MCDIYIVSLSNINTNTLFHYKYFGHKILRDKFISKCLSHTSGSITRPLCLAVTTHHSQIELNVPKRFEE